MTVKDKIVEELKKIENKYLDSADEINSDYNRENDVSDDYKGRQIFELLQNAEDECEEGKGKVLIEYKDNIFRISNTGRPFSFEGVKSLLRANNSPKRIRLNTIGNKGLGFRSILNWANKVSVITDGFALEFSKNNAIEFLKSLFEKKSNLEEDLRKKSKDDFPIAILACPKLIDKLPIDGYVTTIEVECKDNVEADVLSQIYSLDLKELLFLKGLKEVTIKTEEKYSTFVKDIDDDNTSIREIDNISGKETSLSRWKLFKKKGTIDYEDSKTQKKVNKNYEMVIAYDFENKTSGSYLYSFFKTKIPLSFPGIIHGTFELTTDRNQLKPGNILNKRLIDILADFIIETAVTVSELNNNCSYEPLSLILMTEDSESLKEYGFYNLLKDKVVTKKIFPTIKNEYIFLNEEPYFTSLRYDQVLNNDTFNDLLQYCEQDVIRNFLTSKIKFYDYAEFCKRINKDVSNKIYTIEQKCNIINLVKNTYGFTGENLNLLVDTNGNSVAYSEKIYIKPTNAEIINLPSCIESVKFLNEKMQNILMGNGTQQTLSDTYKGFGILPYRFNTLISNVLKALNDNLTEENTLEVLRWLYKFYVSNKNDEDEISVQKIQDSKIPVICRNGIKIATESYFGSEYDNKLGELIVGTYSQNFLKDVELNIDGKNSRSEEIDFLKWIGVSEYPRKKSTSLNFSNNEKKSYFSYVFDTFGKVVNDWNETSLNFDFSVRHITLDSVENIDKIIDQTRFEDIIAWIIVDEDLYFRIKNLREISDASRIECGFYRKVYDRNIKKDYLYSYIRFKFQNAAWIKTKNGPQLPKYCCLEPLGLEPKMFEPIIDYEYLKKAYGIPKLKINSLLQEIGISDQFIDVPIDIQYEVLMALPDIDINKKLSRKLYMIMKTHDLDDIIESNSYKDFIKNGKVLVKYKGEKLFVPVKEAFYVDKKVFSDDLLQQYKIFDIEHRVGSTKVKKIFGVNQINNIDVNFINCTPVNEIINKRFEEDYKDLLPYILVCRKISKSYKADLGRLKKTTVKLVEKLEFSSLMDTEEIRLELNDFETIYFKNKNSAYIKIPNNINSLDMLKNNISFSDAVAEIITTILDVNEEKILFRQLFEGNRSKRDFLIRNDKGDENLELLNGIRKELKYEENLKLDFWTTLGAIKNLNVEDVKENVIIQDLGIGFEISEKIDYKNLNNHENMPLLLEVFTQLEIKVEEYNSMSINTINFIPYYQIQFNKKREEIREKYKFYLYKKYKESKAYKSYEKDLSDFSLYEPDIKNKVGLDVEKILFDSYQITEDILDLPDFRPIDEIIQENRKQYTEEVIAEKINLSNKIQVDLALLFNDLDSIIENEKLEQNEKEIKTQKEINSEAESLIKEIDMDDVEIQRVENDTNSEREKDVKNKGKKKPKSHSKQDDDVKETHGMAGELAVYKQLKNIFPNFQWLSGNAEKYKHISNGDDTLGYDMSYCDEKHQTQYIEVKASTSKNIEFHISKNEINFALKHPDNYNLYYVFLENGKAHIQNLGNIFKFDSGEDLFNNKKFNIENDSYKVSCDIVRK